MFFWRCCYFLGKFSSHDRFIEFVEKKSKNTHILISIFSILFQIYINKYDCFKAHIFSWTKNHAFLNWSIRTVKVLTLLNQDFVEHFFLLPPLHIFIHWTQKSVTLIYRLYILSCEAIHLNRKSIAKKETENKWVELSFFFYPTRIKASLNEYFTFEPEMDFLFVSILKFI